MICNNCGNTIEAYNRFCPKCGAPVQSQPPSPPSGVPPEGFPPYQPPQHQPQNQPPHQPQYQPTTSATVQPRKSSSGCGKILLILGIIALLLAAGIAAAVFFGYRYAEKTLKSSEAYTTAVTTLKQNSEVKEKLGEITDTGFPLGSYSQEADGSGKAAFVMSVQGTKTSGHVEVSLVRSNTIWRVESGILRIANGDVIHISGSTEKETATNDNKEPELNQNVNARNAIKGGVLNSKAISLPKPSYPQVAKAAKASGSVAVHALIDENGNVISARAVSGHPLLQASAVLAAREAKFAPTKVSGKPVKVSGTIVYNFSVE